MTSTVPNRKRICKPATGTVRLLQPLGSIPGQPDTAEILINKNSYLVRILGDVIELVKAAGPKETEPTVYLVATDLSCCNCPDSLYGGRPDGLCKHLKALKALRKASRL